MNRRSFIDSMPCLGAAVLSAPDSEVKTPQIKPQSEIEPVGWRKTWKALEKGAVFNHCLKPPIPGPHWVKLNETECMQCAAGRAVCLDEFLPDCDFECWTPT